MSRLVRGQRHGGHSAPLTKRATLDRRAQAEDWIARIRRPSALSPLVHTGLEELGANVLANRFRLPLPIGAHESEGAQVSQLATGKSKLMVFYSI